MSEDKELNYQDQTKPKEVAETEQGFCEAVSIQTRPTRPLYQNRHALYSGIHGFKCRISALKQIMSASWHPYRLTH